MFQMFNNCHKCARMLCLFVFLSLLASFQAQTANNQVQSKGPNNAMTEAADAVIIAKDTVTDIVENIQKTNIVSCFRKVATALSALGSALSIFSAVFGIISIFLPKAEDETISLINKGFQMVNLKLDSIEDTLTNLQTFIELTAIKREIYRAAQTIEILDGELQRAIASRTRRGLIYFARNFEQSYDYAAERFWKLLTETENSTSVKTDFFDVFCEYHQCSQRQMMQICLYAMETVLKGVNLEATYMGIIQYPRHARKLKDVWSVRFDALKEKCVRTMNKCEYSYESWAKRVTDEFYNANIRNSPQYFANTLQTKLQDLYPFVQWNVFAAYQSDGTNGKCNYVTIPQFYNRYNENNRDIIVSKTYIRPRARIMAFQHTVRSRRHSWRVRLCRPPQHFYARPTFQFPQVEANVIWCPLADQSAMKADAQYYHTDEVRSEPCSGTISRLFVFL